MNCYELQVASVNAKILCHKIAQLNSIIRIMAFSNILCHNRFSVNAASVNTKILCHKIAQLNSIIRIMAFSSILCHNRFSDMKFCLFLRLIITLF